MIRLKIEDIATLLGKSKRQVEEMFNKSDVIELNLNEIKSQRRRMEDDQLRIFE